MQRAIRDLKFYRLNWCLTVNNSPLRCHGAIQYMEIQYQFGQLVLKNSVRVRLQDVTFEAVQLLEHQSWSQSSRQGTTWLCRGVFHHLCALGSCWACSEGVVKQHGPNTEAVQADGHRIGPKGSVPQGTILGAQEGVQSPSQPSRVSGRKRASKSNPWRWEIPTSCYSVYIYFMCN